MPIIAEDLERTSKYTKKWAKRYVTYDPDLRKMTYAVNKESPPKQNIICTRITRFAEIMPARPHSHDLYAVQVEGLADDGKADTWTLRMPDAESFEKWHTAVRGSLAAAGLMDPIGYGLPDEDPRNGLRFATVPLEHLHKFVLLEKAILYYFGLLTVHGYESGGNAMQEHIFAIGDRNMYVFRPNADVMRCVPIDHIAALYMPENPTAAGAFGVIYIQPYEHDIIIKNTNDLALIATLLDKVHKSIKGKHIPTERGPNTSIEKMIEEKKLKIKPMEGYKMKAVSPTPKSKLKIALDLYQQQHGVSYVKGRSQRKEREKAAAEKLKAAAAGGGGDAAGGGEGVADDKDDPLSRMLTRLNLRQYIPVLRKQHVDVDLLSCMEPPDLNNFGVKDAAHCAAIVKAAQERDEKGSPTEEGITPPASSGAPSSPTLDNNNASTAEPASPAGAPPRKVVISLDSDDEDLMPVKRDAPEPAAAASLGATTGQVMLDDSDDDLPVPVPKAAPKVINLDDDDDI